jgi:hypothetical protein
MSINKLIVLGAAFILASLIGSTPAAAVGACDPTDPGYAELDCDLDTILNKCDPDASNYENLDCNGDLILNKCDPTATNYTNLDCDGDLVLNGVDECDATVLGEDLIVGACTISGLDTILPTGCSLTESITDSLAECADGVRNHGKYVSCVAHLTNGLKKQKFITGAQKGQIQSCAAQTDIGKNKPPKH